MNKSIGLIATGYRSAILAIKKLNHKYQEKTSIEHTCPIQMVSPDFYEINSLLPHNTEGAAKLLLPILDTIHDQMLSSIMLVNNTLHESLDIVLKHTPPDLPVLHMGHLINEELIQSKVQKVVILGTKFTMNSAYFQSFIPEPVQIETPSIDLQEKIEKLRLVYTNEENPDLALECVNHLNKEYNEGTKIIVACTELSIAFNPFQDELNMLDTLDIQCEKAVESLFSN